MPTSFDLPQLRDAGLLPAKETAARDRAFALGAPCSHGSLQSGDGRTGPAGIGDGAALVPLQTLAAFNGAVIGLAGAFIGVLTSDQVLTFVAGAGTVLCAGLWAAGLERAPALDRE